MSNVGHHGRFSNGLGASEPSVQAVFMRVCEAPMSRPPPSTELFQGLQPLHAVSCWLVSTAAQRCKRQRLAALAHFEWPVRFIGPPPSPARSGSACQWLALRAAVLRLAVSQLRAADIGGGRWVSTGTLRSHC